jgi:NADH dehydrogenase
MYLIVGATGMVGAEVCRLLALAGAPVRALVRASSDPAKVERLRAQGATVVQGDLRDGISLRAACQGVKAVITTASSMPFAYAAGENTPHTTDEEGSLGLVAAAREEGVQQFVYTSFPPMAASFPLQDAKRAVERRLRDSGLTYTILQPTYFAEVWLSPAVGFDYPNHKAVIYGTGENPISWISFLDVAGFAVASLDNPVARDATLELGGPQGISPLSVIKIFEQAGGRAFHLTHVPVEALQGQLSGATDPMQKSFAGLMLSHASAGSIDMAATLSAFTTKLRTVEEYAQAVMQQQ